MPKSLTPPGVWTPVDDWIEAFQDAQRAEYRHGAETRAEVEREFDYSLRQFPDIEPIL